MPKVRLDFAPPDNPDVTKLHVEEAPAAVGPWTEVSGSPITVSAPDFLSYVTITATSLSDWFRIYWENAGGATSNPSNPIQGGSTTMVQKVVTRVLNRNPTADERVVTDVAEWVVSKVLKTADPYDASLTATYNQLEGMTLLALARTMIHTLVSNSQSDSYTAGLVSQKSSSGSTADTDMIAYLLAEANKILGVSFSVVMLLEDIDPTGLGNVSVLGIDQSRLLLSIE
jgi:hypothetical protein